MKDEIIAEVAEPVDIFNSPEFVETLQDEIDKYINRKAPEPGRRYLRTPYDEFIENKCFTPEFIKGEFAKIAMKTSRLPMKSREYIDDMVIRSYERTLRVIENKQKVAAEKKVAEAAAEKKAAAKAKRAAKAKAKTK